MAAHMYVYRISIRDYACFSWILQSRDNSTTVCIHFKSGFASSASTVFSQVREWIVRVCTFTCIYTWARVHTCTNVHINVRVSYVFIRMCTCTYECVRVSTHVHMNVRMSTCIYACARVHTHVYICHDICHCAKVMWFSCLCLHTIYFCWRC